MTEKLYDNDSFLKEFCATVLECEAYHDSWAVVLDKTAFFPEAGGQKSDRGAIDNSIVSDVQIDKETIYHIVDKPLAVGAEVTGIIDFDRRFDFMQQHSAEHIVSGVAHSLFGCENVGFHLSESIITLDFDKPLSELQLEQLEKKANEAVFKNVEFRCYYPDSETLKSLTYRSKKELEGAVRIVEIENTDMCACCAPHVKRSGEIGLIKLLSFESLRGGIRIELVAGRRALEDYDIKLKNARKISSLLAIGQNEVAFGVERLLRLCDTQKAELTSLKLEGLKEKAQRLRPETEKTAFFEENLTPKDLQVLADLLHNLYGGIRGVFSKKTEGFAFCICGDCDILNSVFADFKSKFTVKGGGRNGMVQGTVLASESLISAFFQNS